MSGVTNEDLVSFDIANDLVQVRTGPTPYGQIILGKIRLPAVEDGYVHVRYVCLQSGTNDTLMQSSNVTC